jgi:dihydroneopterin aldolase/D-erythro-7,8-dihydroneopterin triphosphate epimerase
MAERRLDEIHIRDLALRCVIGVYPQERRAKQDVVVNVTLYAELRAAGRSDRIDDTVDYRAIKQSIVEMVEASSYELIERLAEAVASLCLADEKVLRARVLVEKPGALRFARTVGVEIVRERDADA